MRVTGKMSKPQPIQTLPAGRYHVTLTDVVVSERDRDKEPHTVFVFVAHAGTNPDGVGQTHRERLNHEPNNDRAREINQRQIATLAVEAGAMIRGQGIATWEKLQAIADRAGEVDFDWSSAIGKQLVIGIRARDAEKDGNKVTYHSIDIGSVWQVDDRDVANVPKDQTMLGATKAIEQGF